MKTEMNGYFKRASEWWGPKTIREKLRIVYAGGLLAFGIAVAIKSTAVLIEAAVLGIGGFLMFWTLWSFLSQKWQFMNKFKQENPLAIEIFAFVVPPVLFGGTIAALIAGFLMGACVSFWNMSTQEVVIPGVMTNVTPIRPLQ